MTIHIGRAGSKLGSFSEFEVRQGLASGRFFLTDLGWKEGMETWAPLSQFPELTPRPEPMPPLPDEPALPEAPLPPAEIGLPWDHRRDIGFLNGFLQTAYMVLLNPTEAFRRMLETGSLANPLLYNLIGGWFGAIVSGLYLVLTTRLQPAPGNLTGARALFYLTPALALRETKILIVVGPVLVTVSTLLTSIIAHLFLMLAGGANKSYQVTLRVFCFCYGSAQLLQALPVCGNLLAPTWFLVSCIIGLAAAHNTGTGRSVVAMLLFLAACFACCVGAVMLAVGTDMQSIGPLLKQ